MAVFCKHLGGRGIQANTYFLYDPDKKTALLIDASADLEEISLAEKETGCALKAILLTHGHFDHILTLSHLVDTYHCPVFIHKGDLPALTKGNKQSVAHLFGCVFAGCEANILPDGTELEVEGFKLHLFHTPGHTAGSVCFAIDNHFFSGDTLFANACGRWDLPTGDLPTLQKSLAFLAGYLSKNSEGILYAGHGDPCNIQTVLTENPYLFAF